MITKRMIATLSAVITRLNRDDSLVPRVSSVARMMISSSEPQSTLTEPSCTVVAMPSPNAIVSTSCRYTDQPLATAAAATENSRTRSQPMIHARNSPNVA